MLIRQIPGSWNMPSWSLHFLSPGWPTLVLPAQPTDSTLALFWTSAGIYDLSYILTFLASNEPHFKDTPEQDAAQEWTGMKRLLHLSTCSLLPVTKNSGSFHTVSNFSREQAVPLKMSVGSHHSILISIPSLPWSVLSWPLLRDPSQWAQTVGSGGACCVPSTNC